MEELLRLEGISYRYDDRAVALNHVSVAFHKAERVAVLGRNGAGKSTFFLCCNGILRPMSGKIILNGKEITDKKRDITLLRQAVGLVFQEPDSQIIAATVEDEISFGPMNLGLSDGEVLNRIFDSIKRMNLTGYERRAPQYLSGGEKKRVSIADILAMKPQIILLDEPAASLDPENVALLEATLNDLTSAGIALAVCTHDVDFAYRFATRAVVFNAGEVLADGEIDSVFADESILKKARLKPPLLFEAARLLKARFPGSEAKPPRDIAALGGYIDKLLRF